MLEYRPLNPPEEEEEIEYKKCDHCEDKFLVGKILTLGWGQYCKHCSDNYVENNIRESDDDYQINKELGIFKEQYRLTFGKDYK